MAEKGLNYGSVIDQAQDDAFVEVMFARSQEQADQCRSMLESHQIPSLVRDAMMDVARDGIAVLVPFDLLDAASELLAMNAADDEEDDGGFDDEEEDEFEDDEDVDDDDEPVEDEDY